MRPLAHPPGDPRDLPDGHDGRRPDGDRGAGAVHLPAPTTWPATAALALTLVLYGFVAGLVFTVLGSIVLAVAIGGWIVELRRE